MQAIDHLRKINLFANLNTEQLAQVAELAKLNSFIPGQPIVSQEELGNRFFILDKGLLNLRMTDKAGHEKSVGVIQDLESQDPKIAHAHYFGEQMFTGQEPFVFHIDTLRPSDIYVITRDAWDAFIKTHPAIQNAMTFIAAAERRRTHGFKWVGAGEAVAIVQRKHWWVLLPGLLPALGIALVIVIAEIFLSSFLTGDLRTIVLVGGSLLAIGIVGIQFWDWRDDLYIVTNQRVVHTERFLFSLQQHSVPIDKIVGVSLARQMPASFFGASTVTIKTAGQNEGNVVFSDLPNGLKLLRVLGEQQDRVKARRAAEDRHRDRTMLRDELRHYLLPQHTPLVPPAMPAPRLSIFGRLKRALDPKNLIKGIRTTLRWQTFREFTRASLGLKIQSPGHIIWRTHWIELIKTTWRWFGLLIGLDIAAGVFAFMPGLQFPGYWIGGFVLLFILLGFVWWYWEDWRNDIYEVTDSQVRHSECLPLGLREKTSFAPLDQIQDVRIEVPSTVANILEIGNLKIETAAKGGEMIFPMILHPREAQEEIFKRIEAFKRRKSDEEARMRRRALIDALVTYDALKHEQTHTFSANTPPTTAVSNPAPADAPPASDPGTPSAQNPGTGSADSKALPPAQTPNGS